MKQSAGHHTVWLLACSLLFSFLLTLSCCGPNDTDAAGESSGSGDGAQVSKQPPLVADALARGKSENKIVLLELTALSHQFQQTVRPKAVCRHLHQTLVLCEKSTKLGGAGFVELAFQVVVPQFD